MRRRSRARTWPPAPGRQLSQFLRDRRDVSPASHSVCECLPSHAAICCRGRTQRLALCGELLEEHHRVLYTRQCCQLRL